MNFFSIALPAFLAALALPLQAQQGAAGVARGSGTGLDMLPSKVEPPASNVITEEQFRAIRAAANGGQEAPKPLPPKNHGLSLFDLSTIVANLGQSSLLPKGSVIYCPEGLKARIVSAPMGKLVTWQEFMTANRNWIATCEVDIKHVRGEKPLPEALLTSYKSRNVMVVATLNGCPVTVLPYSPSNASPANPPRTVSR